MARLGTKENPAIVRVETEARAMEITATFEENRSEEHTSELQSH